MYLKSKSMVYMWFFIFEEAAYIGHHTGNSTVSLIVNLDVPYASVYGTILVSWPAS